MKITLIILGAISALAAAIYFLCCEIVNYQNPYTPEHKPAPKISE